MSQAAAGSVLHHALSSRESTVLLARELQTMRPAEVWPYTLSFLLVREDEALRRFGVQVAEGEGFSLSALLGADLTPGGSDKAAMVDELSIPRNDLLAEAAALSPSMATVFSDQAHTEAQAAVRFELPLLQ